MKAMIRSVLVAIAVALAIAPAPALAQEPVDLVQGFLDALNELSGDQELEFAWETAPGSVDVSDAVGDVYTLDGGTPPSPPSFVDLVQESQFGTSFERETYQAVFGQDGALDCARPEISCPAYDTKIRPFADGAIVVGMQLAGEPALAGNETLTLAVLANDDDFPTAQDPRPASPFVGTNKAWRLDLSVDGDAVAFLQVAAGGFQEFHTDARVVVLGELAWFVIPPAEFPLGTTIIGFDAHGYYQDGPDPATGAADSVTDVNPRGELPAPQSRLALLLGQPRPIVEIPEDLPPEAEGSPDEGFDPGVGEVATGEDGDLWDWVLVWAGVIAIVGGGLLIWRGRAPEEDIGPPGPGHTVTRTKPPPEPASTPPPPRVEHAACDWAVYYKTDAGRQLLRPANGRECCVYTISVNMTIEVNELAARGRQEGVRPDAPHARTRIPALVLDAHGLGARVEAAVRSGPAEDLGWMQGLGEPREPQDVNAYRQQRSHEEPPEVAAHVGWVVANVVQIQLESMCPGHINRYTGSASSVITANADVECTYTGPPECPVEFTAAGWVQGKVGIFMDYDLKHQLGSDPDELEPVAPEGTPFHPTTDLHDHERRDRLHYEASEVGSDEANLQDDFLWLTFETGLVADAGTIVPRSIWPATGRVTALAGSTVEHGATIDAEMERVDCVNGPCCGFSACTCAPKLQLRFAGPIGVIVVDGSSYRLTPNPGPVGAGRAWAIG
jgi:hypothetical protein